MGERDDARHQVEQKREHMSRIAHEVSRRMTPGYAKERAREMARDRMYRARDRAVENSWFAPLLGAGIGALVAKTLQSRAQERSWDRDHRFDPYGSEGYYRSIYGYGYGREYPEARERYAGLREEGFAGGAATSDEESDSTLGEKAAELKDRARATAEEMKSRVQEATSSMRQRLPDRERIRESTREDTGLWALGAMALGALFGFALPETEREHELLEPARRKARELGTQAKDMALEKGTAAMERATEKVGSIGTEQRPPQSGSTLGGSQSTSSEPPTPIH
jgi:ElaB/YqjD/DUF883 family membrane-anchored ribosome-binding protein